MAVILESTRFGTLELPPDAVLEFPSGLIGLGGTRYALLARSDESAFLWLHSLDDAGLALPVANPWRFFADFAVELSDQDVERTGIVDPDAVSVYVTVRAASSLEGFTANLRAPIVVSQGRGWQVINQAEDAPVRAALFPQAASEHEEAA